MSDAAFQRALREAWEMIDPFRPSGSPGSYARGYHNGICAALRQVRANYDRRAAADAGVLSLVVADIIAERDALKARLAAVEAECADLIAGKEYQAMQRTLAEVNARLVKAEQQASDARVSWGVLSLVVAERKRQNERWGPAHDDEHTTADFVRFIEHYAGLARDAEIQADPDEARKRLVQVAALAVAAAESIERKFLRCPAPLMGDDGTVADCIAKGHCGCDAKPLAPSGGS